MAAPLVAVFMMFVGRDTVPVSNVVNGKKQTTEGVFVVWTIFQTIKQTAFALSAIKFNAHW